MGQNQSSDPNGGRRGDEGGGAPRRCYYDVIGVDPLATDEELHPAYISCCDSA